MGSLYLDTAIEFIHRVETAVRDRDEYAGLSGMRVDPDGKMIGENGAQRKRQGFIDCGNLERFYKHLTGDKAEIYKTSLLRKYKIPEYEDENFMTEGYVWDKIASDGFIIRWFPIAIYVCEYLEDGLTQGGANSYDGHVNNFIGYCEFVKQSLKVQHSLEAVTFFREYNQTGARIGLTIRQRAEKIGWSPVAYIAYMYLKMPVLYLVRLTALRIYLKIR